MTQEDYDAYLEMQRQLAADLAARNGPEAQEQAIFDEVDAMLGATFGMLSITGGEDVQVLKDGDTFTISTKP